LLHDTKQRLLGMTQPQLKFAKNVAQIIEVANGMSSVKFSNI
jgi:hypothetical protein